MCNLFRPHESMHMLLTVVSTRITHMLSNAALPCVLHSACCWQLFQVCILHWQLVLYHMHAVTARMLCTWTVVFPQARYGLLGCAFMTGCCGWGQHHACGQCNRCFVHGQLRARDGPCVRHTSAHPEPCATAAEPCHAAGRLFRAVACISCALLASHGDGLGVFQQLLGLQDCAPHCCIAL